MRQRVPQRLNLIKNKKSYVRREPYGGRLVLLIMNKMGLGGRYAWEQTWGKKVVLVYNMGRIRWISQKEGRKVRLERT